MKRLILLLILAFCPSAYAGPPPLICQTEDGAVKGPCNKIKFPDGSLTKTSGGTMRYADIFDGDPGASYDPDTNVATFGGSSIGGTGEYIQGAKSGVDFDDCGDGMLKLYARAGTNNESVCVDLETANKMVFTTLTGVDEEVHPWVMTSNMFISGGGTLSSYDLTTAIISFYKMEDNAASLTVVDTQLAHDGTAARNTSLLTTTGKLNNALQFTSSSSDEVALGSTSDFKFSGDFAIEYWQKHTLSTSSKRVLGSRSATGSNIGIELVHVGSTFKTRFLVDIGASSTQLDSTTTTNTGAWFHVVAQRTGGDCELWINGVREAGPSSCSGTLASAGSFYLGGTPLNRMEYSGTLDNVRLYNRALTSDEIAAMYNSGTGTETLSGGVTPIKTIAADDATPDISTGEIFVTSANVGATAITTFDNARIGQKFCVFGGSATNSSTIADSGNFKLSAAMTLGLDDNICFTAKTTSYFWETSRVDA